MSVEPRIHFRWGAAPQRAGLSQKTDKAQNYQLAEALREYRDAMLLLTTTPHAGDPNHGRFINLVKLLETKVDFAALVR